jgi:16S rRNA (uracil1498-N3)-methyltransferase
MSSLIRLFVNHDLKLHGEREILSSQCHYLKNVMRLVIGDDIALFNGQDGEFIAEIIDIKKKSIQVRLKKHTRTQKSEPDVWLLFAPVKKNCTDIIAEKATELGVSKILPVITDYTNVARVKIDRLRSNAVEAAEQSSRLSVPDIQEPQLLLDVLAGWNPQRRLLVMDETKFSLKGAKTEIMTMSALGKTNGGSVYDAILVGPEGGFSPYELDQLGKLFFVTKVSLGTRVLRSETAVVAALALWNELLSS